MKVQTLFLILLCSFMASSCLEKNLKVKLNGSGSKSPWPIVQLGALTHAVGGENSGDDYCSGTAVDIYGNIYCAGYTSGAIGEANGGGYDVFVMKMNSSGVLQWVTQLGAATHANGGNNSGDDYCSGVAVDVYGNVYCAGYTTGAIGEANSGHEDAFVMKLDSSGTIEWVKQLGAVTHATGGANTGYDMCNGVAVDSSGNVYCAGGSLGTIGEANAGHNDAFILKLNSNGVLQWVTQLGAVTHGASGNNSGDDYCNGVAVDSSNNVYCAGYTSGAIGEANAGSYDAFVMKLNSSGALQWVKQLGAVTHGTNGDNSGADLCNGIAVDSSSNVYCAGYTSGAMGEVNGGDSDAFIMKLNSSGALQWVKQLGAVTHATGGYNSGNDNCTGVTVDSSGNAYCAGTTSGAMGEANGGNYDAFIMKLNSSGALQWVKQLGAFTHATGGNNSGNENCNGITVDSAGNVYCAGYTSGAMGEANGGGGNYDAFIMKFNSSGQLY